MSDGDQAGRQVPSCPPPAWRAIGVRVLRAVRNLSRLSRNNAHLHSAGCDVEVNWWVRSSGKRDED